MDQFMAVFVFLMCKFETEEIESQSNFHRSNRRYAVAARELIEEELQYHMKLTIYMAFS